MYPKSYVVIFLFGNEACRVHDLERHNPGFVSQALTPLGNLSVLTVSPGKLKSI